MGIGELLEHPDDVVGAHRLAVVERDVLAQLEGPDVAPLESDDQLVASIGSSVWRRVVVEDQVLAGLGEQIQPAGVGDVNGFNARRGACCATRSVPPFLPVARRRRTSRPPRVRRVRAAAGGEHRADADADSPPPRRGGRNRRRLRLAGGELVDDVVRELVRSRAGRGRVVCVRSRFMARNLTSQSIMLGQRVSVRLARSACSNGSSARDVAQRGSSAPRPSAPRSIGAGPSGFYATEALLKQGFEVDLYDALPTPFGLVRAGVAPDHPKIKSVTRVYTKTASNPAFRFFGAVTLGTDIIPRGAAGALPRDRLRDRDRDRQPARDPGRGPARVASGDRVRGLVQRPPAFRRPPVRPQRRPRGRDRQRQRRDRRRADAGARPGRTGADRHRRPRDHRVRDGRRLGGGAARSPRSGAGRVHQPGAA